MQDSCGDSDDSDNPSGNINKLSRKMLDSHGEIKRHGQSSVRKKDEILHLLQKGEEDSDSDEEEESDDENENGEEKGRQK